MASESMPPRVVPARFPESDVTLVQCVHGPTVDSRRERSYEVLMDHTVGIWIDHKRAVIVSVSAGRATTKTLESEVGAHPRYSGQQDGGGEKKYEERHRQRLERYYDDVIGQLGQPEALLIFGPGEAKLELNERLSRSKTFSERTIDIETADRLTDPQIVARVKEHFRIDR